MCDVKRATRSAHFSAEIKRHQVLGPSLFDRTFFITLSDFAYNYALGSEVVNFNEFSSDPLESTGIVKGGVNVLSGDQGDVMVKKTENGYVQISDSERQIYSLSYLKAKVITPTIVEDQTSKLEEGYK